VDPLRRYWHPTIRASDLREIPLRVRVLGEELVLWRTGETIVCMQDLCIHRGSALSLGWVEEEKIVCAYHGWEYAPDGRCIRIPSLPPGRSIPRKARAQTYRATVRYGLIWVCQGEPAADLPAYPAYDDPGYGTVLYEPFVWRASAARIIENVLDYTHFPWVHSGMLGNRAHPVYPEVRPRVSDTGLAYEVPDTANNTVRYYQLYAPFSLDLTVRSNDPAGKSYSMLFTCVPVSATETIQWFFSSRNWSQAKPDLEWNKFDEIVMGQDQRIVENQRPELLPLDLSAELHLRGTDAGALEYRRLLKRLGVAWH
jgi:phenylpropionate dioxygenase-like ring-hydroxylating dioxygenase large terminal subunit